MKDSYGALLPTLYTEDAVFGWRRGMTAVTLAIFDDVRGPVLELGCGRGDFLVALAQRQVNGPLWGIDLHLNAFAAAHAAPIQLLRGDAQRTPLAAHAANLVLALDVLDQRGVEPRALLAECRRVLRLDGRLVVRVSAHPWLYSPHDRAFNTERRYRRSELTTLLSESGFRVQRVTYANTLLAAPTAGLRLLQQHGWLAFDDDLYDAGWSNRLLALALQAEARWLQQRDLPLGLSLLAVATPASHS